MIGATTAPSHQTPNLEPTTASANRRVATKGNRPEIFMEFIV